MDKLTYKDFVWPRNPEVYKMRDTRELVYSELSDGYQKLEGVGDLMRVVTGSGVFAGETAYQDFKALEALCHDPEVGWLVHPVWGKMAAFLIELEVTQEPRENYVAYSFKFLDGEITGDVPPV